MCGTHYNQFFILYNMQDRYVICFIVFLKCIFLFRYFSLFFVELTWDFVIKVVFGMPFSLEDNM
jgi:hypothetical protein